MKKILLVDDEPKILKNLTKLLEKELYKVDNASTGVEALEKLRCNNYDVVILDYKMPKMNGLEVLKAIEKEALGCTAIMLTGHVNFQLMTDAVKHQAVTILSKPVEFSRLLSEIRKAIQKDEKKKFQPKRECEPILKETAEKESILVADDSGAFRRMITSCLRTEFRHYNYIEAKDGLEALTKLKENPNIKLIIIDINMPRMTGIEFMELKEKTSNLKKIPVILISTEKEEDVMKNLHLSCKNVFVHKPFKYKDLIEAGKKIIS